MSSQAAPRNRKERRAQAKQTGNTNDIPLARPKERAPKGKTLIEIAEERQLLQKSGSDAPSITTTQINPDGSITELPEHSDPASTPYLDILLYSTSLIILHFTLTLLVHHQYASERPSLLPLFLSAVVFSPAPWLILFLVATLHPRASHPLMQVLFAGMAVVGGAWLVKASNDDPYLAVMKKAPALGTLWLLQFRTSIEVMPSDILKPSPSSFKPSSSSTKPSLSSSKPSSSSYKPLSSSSRPSTSTSTALFPTLLATEMLITLLVRRMDLSTRLVHAKVPDIRLFLTEVYGYDHARYWTFLSLTFPLENIDWALCQSHLLPQPEEEKISDPQRRALMDFVEKTQKRDREAKKKMLKEQPKDVAEAYVKREARRKRDDKEGLLRIVVARLNTLPLVTTCIATQGSPIPEYSYEGASDSFF
ncbi:MAG: hypothetical protein Q9222_002595 [Ikaeria aurantiellina]